MDDKRRSASRASGRRAAGFFKMNTKSTGGRADRFRRKRSRRMRLTALRETALGATFRPTAMPSLGTPTRFGPNRRSSHSPRKHALCRNTAAYCSRVSRRAPFGRVWSKPSLHREAMATFSAASADHCPAPSRSHAHQKAMTALATNDRWLIRPLHDFQCRRFSGEAGDYTAKPVSRQRRGLLWISRAVSVRLSACWTLSQVQSFT
jgi:hypothetical protein